MIASYWQNLGVAVDVVIVARMPGPGSADVWKPPIKDMNDCPQCQQSGANYYKKRSCLSNSPSDGDQHNPNHDVWVNLVILHRPMELTVAVTCWDPAVKLVIAQKDENGENSVAS